MEKLCFVTWTIGQALTCFEAYKWSWDVGLLAAPSAGDKSCALDTVLPSATLLPDFLDDVTQFNFSLEG